MSALVSKRSWVRILPELPVDQFYLKDTRKALHLCQGKNQVNYKTEAKFHQSDTYRGTRCYIRF